MMRRDIIVLTSVAMVVRILVAFVVDAAPWTDSAYYLVSGQRLATGHGLTLPFVWSVLETGGQIPAIPGLPIPSHAHWMPLAAFVAAAGMAIGGPSEMAARAPFLLLSTAMTPVAYAFAWQTWRSRSAAVAAGLLVIFAGPLLLFGSIVENYAVFGLAGAGAIHAAMRSVADPAHRRAWLIGSGALVGLATLARIEGVLLAIATAMAWLIGMGWTGWRADGSRPGWLAGFASALAFSAVVAPWAIRNLMTFGAALPSTGGHTLWITNYNQQFSISDDPSLSAYLAQGPLTILGQKVGAWITIGGYTLALLAGVFGILFVAGLWIHRRRAEVAPFIVYWVVMFIVMGGLFTFHAPHGLYYHHASAWLPIGAPLAAMTIAPLATAGSRWWRFLGRPATHRFLLAATLVAAIPFSVVASALLLVEWRTNLAAVERVATFLELRPDDERVMFRDAPMLATATEHPVIGSTYDPYLVIEEVIDAYDVRWFVAQRQARGPAVEPQGLWDGGAAVDDHGNRADWLAIEPAYADSLIRIYEVVETSSP
ncbi:MAG: ArnT family glycosyltransferase [Chloroflexota bacterium]